MSEYETVKTIIADRDNLRDLLSQLTVDRDEYKRLAIENQGFLSQLREELAQRDAEVDRLGYLSAEQADRLLHGRAIVIENGKLRERIAALESQQAASVVGEREAFDAWFRRVKGLNDTVDTTFVSEAFFPYKAFKFGIEYGSAALSPAGGGVVMPDPDFVLDSGTTPCYYAETVRVLLARLNAKPQANSQEGE